MQAARHGVLELPPDASIDGIGRHLHACHCEIERRPDASLVDVVLNQFARLLFIIIIIIIRAPASRRPLSSGGEVELEELGGLSARWEEEEIRPEDHTMWAGLA